MRFLIFAFLCLITAGHASALEARLVEVAAADRLLVTVDDWPVIVRMAHVASTGDEAMDRRASELIRNQVGSEKIDLVFKEHFGTDDEGVGACLIMVEDIDINLLLISRGLVRYTGTAESNDQHERYIRNRDAAQREGLGIHAGSDAALTVSRAASRLPFVSELGSEFYHPRDSDALAGVRSSRLIYYASEEEAQRAGKRPPPGSPTMSDTGTLADADRLYDEGSTRYGEALQQGPTRARDDLYRECFELLSRAVQIYTEHLKQHPDDTAVANKLTQASRLRYGAMKQRVN